MISYLSSGKASKVSHVLLHGIGSNADSWQAQLDAVADSTDIKILAWHAPGYKDSAALALDAPTAADYAKAMWAWLDTLENKGIAISETFTLVGHSLGCLIAASAASLRPQRIKKLILFSPAQGYGDAARFSPALREEKLQTRLNTLHTLGIEGMARTRSAALLSPNATQAMRDAAYKNMAALNVRGYMQAAMMLANGDLLADIEKVHCPIVVASGELDTATPPTACRDVAVAANTNWINLGEVGHMVAMEAAQAVNELIFNDNSKENSHAN